MPRYARSLPLLALLLVCFSTSLLLQGCGGGKGGDGKPGADGKTIITFWHFQSEPGQKKALMERIKAFEDENPTIHVELQDLSWNDGKAKLMSAFNASTAPDMLELGSDWVAQFAASGKLADQLKLGGDSTGRFTETILAPGKWNNGVYAWPWTSDTRVLFVNQGLLAQAGVDTTKPDETWDDVLNHAEMVQKLRANDQGIYGFGANGSDQHRLYKKILPFFWSNGGDVLNSQGVPVINSAENVAALEMYLSLARAGFTDSQKGLDQLFVSGKLGYWISGPWLVDRIAKDKPDLHYVLRTLPKFAGKNAVSFAGGEYLAINGASAHQQEAKKLIAFLTSPKQALEFAKALPGGTTPADLSLANDPFLQGPARKVFTEQLRSSRMTPMHPKWLEMEKAIEDAVAEALQGDKDAKAALDQAQYGITLAKGGNDSSGTGEEAGQ
ncbi:MAG: sugar ABC transporter substrate-binding protein [Bacteroidota bacterium]